jgi:hypothetical protein
MPQGLETTPTLSFQKIRSNGNHVMWWGVFKSKEVVDLKKPPKRIFAFEFRNIH